MHNTVHKKKDEIILWEVGVPGKNRAQKRETKKQEGLSVIPTNERTGTAGSVRVARGAGTAGSARVARGAGTAGSARTARGVKSAGSARTAGNVRNAGNVRTVQVVHSARPQQRSPLAIKRRNARKRRAYFCRTVAFLVIGVCLALFMLVAGTLYKTVRTWGQQDTAVLMEKTSIFATKEDGKVTAPEISTAFLEVNDYSRPGTPLNEIKNIFVHYTANPGTSAAQNRSYFANLAETHERSASAHFIIGYEGEIIQCIPLEEQAYAVMTRNEDSISIECCYIDENGKFTQETYDSLIHLLAWLTQEYKLNSDDILRHYDCGGKLCPVYYVEHEDLWAKLLADVDAYREFHNDL